MDESLLNFIFILLGAAGVFFFIYFIIKFARRVMIPWIRGSRHRKREMLIKYGPNPDSKKKSESETTYDSEDEKEN